MISEPVNILKSLFLNVALKDLNALVPAGLTSTKSVSFNFIVGIIMHTQAIKAKIIKQILYDQ